MTDPSPTKQVTLQGRRILVVEDEYMIAQEISEALLEAGAEALGPVSSVAEAKHLISMQRQIDGAFLDVNLGKEAIWPAVDMLLSRHVPLVLSTGYDAAAIPQAYVHLPRCEKPMSGLDLTRTLVRILADAANTE